MGPGLLRAAEDQVAKRARLELGERGERRRADRAELGLESVQERVRDVRSLGRERAGGDVQDRARVAVQYRLAKKRILSRAVQKYA